MPRLPMREQRRARVPLRLVLLIAAVFAMLAVLGGGAGLVLGKIASGGAAEHRYHRSTFYEEDWHGPGPFGDEVGSHQILTPAAYADLGAGAGGGRAADGRSARAGS